MRGPLELVIYAGGIVLLTLMVYPIYTFAVETGGGALELEVYVPPDASPIELRLVYGVSVPLHDAVLEVGTSSGEVFSARDEVLEPGEVLVLRLPPEVGDRIAYLRVSGSIVGVYMIDVEISAEGGVAGLAEG